MIKKVINPTVIALLLLYLSLAISNALQLSFTFDETAHLTAGISYWQTHDYRLHPENGLLPQRWASLPSYALSPNFHFQKLAGWTQSNVWEISGKTLFKPLINHHKILFFGRCMIIFFGVLLAILIYQWSKHLYGKKAALISLSLYCISPTILAHSSIVTSDFIFTFFLLLSIASLWHLLHSLKWSSLLGFGLTVGALFLSKLSAVLFIPSAIMMIFLRLILNKPWSINLYRPILSTHYTQQFGYLIFVILSTIVISSFVIWAAYGFRYSLSFDINTHRLYDQWSNTGLLGLIVHFFADYQLLPEAYLYGISFVSQHIERMAFITGKYSFFGWPYYFPYTFLIKTPLPILILLLFSAYCLFKKAKASYNIIPLFSVLIIYILYSFTTSLNIGHRHILPVYPVLFILCGSLIDFIKIKPMQIAIYSLLLWLALESIIIAPNHLSYFNQIIGGPKQGYRHLLDSSLDWGQNLPQLKHWLDERHLNDKHKAVYLAYFGSAPVTSYGINIKQLPGYIDRSFYQKYHQPIRDLKAGTYIISANILQSLYSMTGELGPWTQAYENQYQQLRQRQWIEKNRWDKDYFIFRNLRLARLCAYLKQHPPKDYIGYSLLVYQLSEKALQQALFSTAAELFATDQVIRSKR